MDHPLKQLYVRVLSLCKHIFEFIKRESRALKQKMSQLIKNAHTYESDKNYFEKKTYFQNEDEHLCYLESIHV